MLEFATDVAAKGLLTRIIYEQEIQYPSGLTLNEAFGKETVDLETHRYGIEAQIARYGRGTRITWEWLDNDEETIVTHGWPAIHTQPDTKLPTFVTGLARFYPRKSVTKQLYGDGTPTDLGEVS